MTQFTCHGPYKISVEVGAGGKSITDDKGKIAAFWESTNGLETRRGCYVFGIKTGRNVIPYYIGKATEGFGQEIFTNDKRTKYQKALNIYLKGAPAFFFLPLARAKGPANRRHIKELEIWLIHQGAVANPNLLNKHYNTTANWQISGILRSPTKKPTNGAKLLRQSLKL